ncbi:MAG TPA: hypothetical protein VNZ22_08465 [Bacillota bacterium]|nr:hypothetical protein [Bacillota bacterium]
MKQNPKTAEMDAALHDAAPPTTHQVVASAYPPQQADYSVFGVIVLSVAAWFIWRPLGTFIAITAIGQLRGPIQRRAMVWEHYSGLLMGLVLGCATALLVWTLAYFAVHSAWAKSFFGLQGFLYAGFVGFGIPHTRHLRLRWKHEVFVTQRVSMLMYLITTGGFLGGPAIWRGI